MSYTLKFVDSEEFSKLPYKGASEALGIADRNKGIAYVRDTANPMDVFTAFHELEHLKGDDLGEHESPDEQGIYYKGFKDIFNTVDSAASMFNPGGIIGKIPSFAINAFGGKQKQPQPQQQQGTMDQFNPATSMTQAPATSPAGSPGGSDAGGGLGGGTIDKVRQMMNQRQSGFYAGRDAGGM